jgi:hypothetical protein
MAGWVCFINGRRLKIAQGIVIGFLHLADNVRSS